MATIRGWKPSEIDFELTANPTETVISEGGDGEVEDRDAIFDTTSNAEVRTEAQVLAASFAGNVVQFSSRNPAVATVDQSGRVSWVSNGTTRIDARTPRGRRAAQVTVSSQGGQTSRTFNRYTPGSLVDNVASTIDGRLEGLTPSDTTKKIFSTSLWDTPLYVRNPNCWAYGLVGLEALGAWNYKSRSHATLLTSRVCILAGHDPAPMGSTLRWVNANNQVFDYTVTASVFGVGTSAYDPLYQADICLHVLDRDVDDSIPRMPLLPNPTCTRYFSCAIDYPANQGKVPVPLLGTDQEDKVLVTEFTGVLTGPVYRHTAQHSTVYTASRLPWWEMVAVGDSGSAVCLPVNGRLALFSMSGGVQAGSLMETIPWLDEVLLNLSGETVERIDLSDFPTYDE